MRVTQKGQVTIPKPIREKLGIGPGSEVEFIDRGADGVAVINALDDLKGNRAEQFQHWLARVQGTMDLGGKSVDELMLEMRGPRDDQDVG